MFALRSFSDTWTTALCFRISRAVVRELFVLVSGTVLHTIEVEEEEEDDEVEEASDDDDDVEVDRDVDTPPNEETRDSSFTNVAFSAATGSFTDRQPVVVKRVQGTSPTGMRISQPARLRAGFPRIAPGHVRPKDSSPGLTQRHLSTGGTALCELGFLFSVRQPASLEAVGTVTCLSLPAAAFSAISRDFANDVARMKVKAIEQATQRNEGAEGLEVKEVKEIQIERGKRMVDVMYAAAADDEDAVAKFFSGEATSVDDADYEGKTVLMVAASHGSIGVVKLMLAQKASTNMQDRAGKTALDAAARHGFDEICKVLRAKGAMLSWSEVETSGELCEAARAGEIEKLTRYLDFGADVNAADYDSRTCLHLAASIGNETMCKLILKRGGRVNVHDRWGHTPTSEAFKAGHASVARLLGKANGQIDINGADAAGELCELARTGAVEQLRLFLELSKSGVVNESDYDQRTALMVAACEGILPAVELLLSYNADPNMIDRFGSTALGDAIQRKHMDVARVLANAGSKLTYDDSRTSSELCDLAQKGDVERLIIYLDAGLNSNAQDYDKRSAIHLAASEGQHMIISALVERGADVNIRDRWGSSPLTDAIRVGSLEVARKLIQSGANLNLGLENIQEKSLSNETDAAGWLCELARAGDTLRLSLLLEGNINPDAADYDARTCLHLAASEGQMPVVSALMTSGANANVQDRWGNTQLCDAIREGHTQVARLLRKHGAELLLPDAEASSRLCEHARVGDVEKVKLLLECGCNPDLCDYDNRTASF